MNILVKKTREVGTSAGVLLPRSWLNKEVVVTLLHPSKERILKEVTEYLINNKLNEEVKGIYIYGSHARGESDPNSDIDILIITQETNKLINYDNYEILLVSEKNFAEKLPKNLAYLSALKEAEVLLNKNLLDLYRKKNIKLKIKDYIKEIESVTNINEEAIVLCEKDNKMLPDGIIYSIVLRLKELHLIKSLKSRKPYSNAVFLKFVPKEVNSAYLRVKRNEKELNNISPDELIPLISLSKKWLKELKE